MDQARIDKLTRLLKRLNAGENPASLRREAQEFLAGVDPADLSLAEQKLIEAGLAPEDLRHLCSVHMEMMEGQLDQMKSTLKPGHVIDTLVSEHEMILGFLDELETTNHRIQKMNKYESRKPEFATLRHVAEHLVGAEKHHQREEDVLFPEIERRGVFGPTHLMKREHEELRARKHELAELAKNVETMDFGSFKKRLDATAKAIVLTLRDHIFKENNILYPTALEVIPEETMWEQMKTQCDKIGYCCFTPVREDK